MQVVVANVKLLETPQPTEPTAGEPAQPAAAAPVAGAQTAPAPAVANATKLSNATKPATTTGTLKPESAPVRRMSKLLRRLMADPAVKANSAAAKANSTAAKANSSAAAATKSDSSVAGTAVAAATQPSTNAGAASKVFHVGMLQ